MNEKPPLKRWLFYVNSKTTKRKKTRPYIYIYFIKSDNLLTHHLFFKICCFIVFYQCLYRLFICKLLFFYCFLNLYCFF